MGRRGGPIGGGFLAEKDNGKAKQIRISQESGPDFLAWGRGGFLPPRGERRPAWANQHVWRGRGEPTLDRRRSSPSRRRTSRRCAERCARCAAPLPRSAALGGSW